MKPPLRVIALTKQSPDYGGHSSYYTQAFEFEDELNIRLSLTVPRPGLWPRIVGKAFSRCIGAGARNQSGAAAEFAFFASTAISPSAVGHIANVEDHLPLLASLRRPRARWIGTVHFPPSQWRDADALMLRRCARVITLCRRDRDYFGALLGAERVVLIPHGVDTAFFSPKASMRSTHPRAIFVGKWLRDFARTSEVLKAALDRWPTLQADLVVSRRWISDTPLAAFEGHPRVHWHENVSDDELLRLYRRAWVLLLPLLDTSANNALVEAMASGLAPVVNDVGGVVDYGGNTVFPTSADRDGPGLFALLASYLDDPARAIRCGEACRAHVLAHLDWRLIRALQRDLYEQVSLEGQRA